MWRLPRKLDQYATWPIIIVLFLITQPMGYVFMRLLPPLFAESTGVHVMIDIQAWIPAAEMLAQVETYTELSYQLYEIFMWLDWVLPPVEFSMAVLLLLRWGRRIPPYLYDHWMWVAILPPIIACAADLIENVFFTLMVFWPEYRQLWLAQTARVFHDLKLIGILSTFASVFAVAAAAYIQPINKYLRNKAP